MLDSELAIRSAAALTEEASALTKKSSFTYEQLLACGRGEMFGAGNAQLPLPPMLMFDRIIYISDKGGIFGKGEIVAELDLRPEQLGWSSADVKTRPSTGVTPRIRKKSPLT